MTDRHTQLLYNFANNILSAFGAFTGAALTDKINRRPRLYIGAFTLACLLSVVAALSSKYGKDGNTNVHGANATITFIFLFGIVYSFTYTPLQALYCAEVLNQRMRAKGMAGTSSLFISLGDRLTGGASGSARHLRELRRVHQHVRERGRARALGVQVLLCVRRLELLRFCVVVLVLCGDSWTYVGRA